MTAKQTNKTGAKWPKLDKDNSQKLKPHIDKLRALLKDFSKLYPETK